ncbi:hypothetical protein C8R44DRAFT_442856 [Mycena epipterygia]|nr:hypothetical protein C8R44DRAFT_442856 [Mycena epipterygia]
MSSAALTAARMSYAAALVACIGYGIYVVIAYQCVRRLVRRTDEWTSSRVALLAYTILLFVLQTVYFVAGCKWSEIEFVETLMDPAVFASQQSSTLAVLKGAVYTVNIWLADAFLLYRAYIVWGRNYVVFFPMLTYLGSIAMGMGLLVEISKPGAVFGQAAIINFGTPFWSLSVATNVLSTILIAGRLAYRRRAIHQIRKDQARYTRNSTTSTSAIFAESAGLYAVAALIYIPLFARNLALQYPFSALLGVVVSIAPTLIILRMAGGTAVTREWSTLSPEAVGSAPGVRSMDKAHEDFAMRV